MIAPLFILTLWLTACAPPEAPDALQELASFTFGHADDEDDAYLRAALNNLDAWLELDHEEDIEEGYQINLLDPDGVADLEGDNHTLSAELIGAAVAHESTHTVDELARALTIESWEEITVDQFEYYTKIWDYGEDCIATRDCLAAEATSDSEMVQLGISVVSTNRILYRWVEMDKGWALVHRSYLTQPPVVSSDLIKANSQYFIAVTLPREVPMRVQATWIDTEILGVSVPKSIVVNTMRDQGDLIESWMDDNY